MFDTVEVASIPDDFVELRNRAVAVLGENEVVGLEEVPLARIGGKPPSALYLTVQGLAPGQSHTILFNRMEEPPVYNEGFPRPANFEDFCIRRELPLRNKERLGFKPSFQRKLFGGTLVITRPLVETAA